MNNRNYIVIPPAGSGSKGDEGMMRGALRLFSPANFIVMNPQPRTWFGEIGDSEIFFSEEKYDISSLQKHVLDGYELIIVGADVIDGSAGVSGSILRLDAIENALKFGVAVYVFFSFRSDTELEIINRLKVIAKNENVFFYPRDPDSKARFDELCDPVNSSFFPDLAFFCNENKNKTISVDTQNRNFIAVNFSEQSFRATNVEYTDSNRIAYIETYLDVLLDNLQESHIYLISNDIRKWSNFWSDYDYAIAAENLIKAKWPTCKVQTIDPVISYSTLIGLLRSVSMLVSGRMHLAIAAVRAGCMPIIVTGHSFDSQADEKQRGMYDKARGMLEWCLGRKDFVVTSTDELRIALEEFQKLKTLGFESLFKFDDQLVTSYGDEFCRNLKKSTGFGAEGQSIKNGDISRYVKVLKTEKFNLEQLVFELEQEVIARGEWALSLEKKVKDRNKIENN